MHGTYVTISQLHGAETMVYLNAAANGNDASGIKHKQVGVDAA